MENLPFKLAGTGVVMGLTGIAGTMAWALTHLDWAEHLTAPPAALLISLGLFGAGLIAALWSALISTWFPHKY